MSNSARINPLNPAATDQRRTQTEIQISIDKSYRQAPVLSHLIREYGLTVNITGALLPINIQDDGWFNLELQGTVGQIRSAITYLNDLDVQIWRQTEIDDSW